MPPDDSSPPDSADIFATTHWSVVLAAGPADNEKSLDALQKLCETYWRPVYVFVRRKGFSPDDSEELTQEYFAQLLKSHSFRYLDREKGKFRAFLLASVKNFLANEWDRRTAKKRGSGRTILSLDQASGEAWFRAVDSESPDLLFERRWALTLLESVMKQLQDEFSRRGQAPLFEALKPALSGDGQRESHSVVGERLGMTEGAVKVAIHRLRQKYRAFLRAEIGRTVASPGEIEEEIRYLFQLFQ